MTDIREPRALNSVRDRHNLFNVPVQGQPVIPAPERCELRVNLLQEELNEFKEAIAQGDLVEIADALADLQYVLSGAVLEFGLQDIFAELFDEVQRSNMSKACTSEQEALATVAHYADRDQPANIVEKDNMRLVYRNSDDKVLKSVGYSPADLASRLQAFQQKSNS